MRLEKKITTIGDSANLLSGFAFKSTNFSNEKKHAFLVKGSNIGHMSIDYDAGPWWENHEDPKIQKYLLQDNDVILAMDRPIVGNQLKYSWIKPNSPKSLLVQRVARLRGKNGLETDYLRYVIGSHEFQAYLETITTGANIPHISGPNIKKYRFPLPDIKTQQKIAGILSAYDDLIENNLKRIKLLEELAQITYEEWFVRLRFPGHESTPINPETNLPEGWEIKSIGELIEREIGGGWGLDEIDSDHTEPAYVIRGTDIDSLNTSNIENVPFRFHKKSNLRSRKLTHGDIVFEVSGGSRTEGVAKTGFITDTLLKQFGQDVMCASFCKLVHPIDESVGLFLFHYFKFLREIKATEIFEIRGASSIINYNWTAFLKFQKVVMPPEGTIKDFYSETIIPHNEIQNLARQNQRLREARDILLPRLMTGMIDVEKYDPAKLMQEVA